MLDYGFRGQGCVTGELRFFRNRSWGLEVVRANVRDNRSVVSIVAGAFVVNPPECQERPRSGRVKSTKPTCEGGSHGPRYSPSGSSMHLKRRHSWNRGLWGKNIGEIDHLIIDKVSGRVAYAVMSFGGFVGLGHSHYPIPWGALTYDTSLGGFRTNITEQQLKDAPEFSDDSWQDRDWEARTHQYYGTPTYWESRGGLIR